MAWAAALVLTLAGSASAQSPRPRLLLMATSGTGVVPAELVALQQVLQTEVTAADAYAVTSPENIEQILGVERQRQLLGCGDDSTCLAELVGAIDAQRMLSSTLSRAGDSLIVQLTLLDGQSGGQVHRAGARVPGAGKVDAALAAIPDLVRQLVEKDPLVKRVERRRVFVVGLRGEVDLNGPGVAPVLAFSWEPPTWYGAAAAVVAAPIPGIRAEGRLHPFRFLVTPYLGLGATAFTTSVAPRLALGGSARFSFVAVTAEVAVERYLTGRFVGHLAVIGSLGAGFAF